MNRPRQTSDKIFDFTFSVITWGANALLFILLVIVCTLIFALAGALFFDSSSLLVPFILAIVASAFAIWFFNKLINDSLTGVVAIFGNNRAQQSVLEETEPQSETARKLEELRDLRNRSLINQEEYDKKRDEILRNL